MAAYIPELTEKEREVILTIAREGPKTGYDFTQGARKNKINPAMSTATWEEIKKRLGPQGFKLIEELQQNEGERGRPKKPYWLSMLGIFAALKLGANPKALQLIVRDLGQSDEVTDAFFDLAGIMGKAMFNTYADNFLEVARSDGSIDLVKLEKVGGPPILTDSVIRKKTIAILKKYPIFREAMEESIEQTYRLFKKGGLDALAGDVDALTGEMRPPKKDIKTPKP